MEPSQTALDQVTEHIYGPVTRGHGSRENQLKILFTWKKKKKKKIAL